MEIWYLGRTDSTIKSGGTLLLFRKVSSDGVHWSEYEIMRDLVGYLSPSIVYSEGKYKLWAIEPSTSGREGALAYSESTDGDTWTPFEKCTFGGYYGIEKIWHGAVSLDDTYRFAFIEDSGKSNTICILKAMMESLGNVQCLLSGRRISGKRSTAHAFSIAMADYIAYMESSRKIMNGISL